MATNQPLMFLSKEEKMSCASWDIHQNLILQSYCNLLILTKHTLFYFLHQIKKHLFKKKKLKEKPNEDINARPYIWTKYFPQTTLVSEFWQSKGLSFAKISFATCYLFWKNILKQIFLKFHLQINKHIFTSCF